jgi:two-component system sensor histidine kinase ChvG
LESDVYVRASEDLMESVVESIIDNSISVSPPGGQIVVTLRRAQQWAEMTIRDQGPGVPPEDLERIFQRRFSRRPKGLVTASGQGVDEANSNIAHAGIGLWIVRRNVEAIGGRVRAENAADGGLVMDVQVPLAA